MEATEFGTPGADLPNSNSIATAAGATMSVMDTRVGMATTQDNNSVH